MPSVVERFKALVPIDNPSGGEDVIRNAILAELHQIGDYESRVDDAGNLFVTVPGRSDKPTILLSAHMDSVPPCHGIEAVEDTVEGRPVIRSSGKTILGADDKSGIATILAIVERLAREGSGIHAPLELLFSTREEVGLIGAKAFDMAQSQAAMGIVLDGEGQVGEIFNAGPTQKNLLFQLEGKRAHAGMAPEKGVNAITMAAHLCAKLPSGRLSSVTTMNIGVIEGGEAMNVVAPSATLKGEARSHDEDALNQLLKQVADICRDIQQNFPGGSVGFTPTHRYTGFHVAEDHAVVSRAWEACRRIGVMPRTAKMNIGSDAHILNQNGLPTVVLGMGFHYSHSLGEFIYTDELEQVSQWVWEIIHA